MFSEAKVTEIYCMTDDFCKEFAIQQEKYMVKDTLHKHRYKPNRVCKPYVPPMWADPITRVERMVSF